MKKNEEEMKKTSNDDFCERFFCMAISRHKIFHICPDTITFQVRPNASYFTSYEVDKQDQSTDLPHFNSLQGD